MNAPGRHSGRLRRLARIAAAGAAAAAVAIAVAMLAPRGCRDKPADISNSDYLLKRQHEVWLRARDSLRSASPNLNLLRAVDSLLHDRVQRRVRREYSGQNKDHVLDQLEELSRLFQQEVLPKLNISGREVTLAPGTTIDQLRAAFEKLDPKYQALIALTRPT